MMLLLLKETHSSDIPTLTSLLSHAFKHTNPMKRLMFPLRASPSAFASVLEAQRKALKKPDIHSIQIVDTDTEHELHHGATG